MRVRGSTASLRRLDEPIELDKKFKHEISIVVDRLVMKEGVRKRLSESVEAASQLADGLVEVETLADGDAEDRGHALQRTLRLPQVRHLDARAGAADLLLQLASRLLPALPRARLPAGHRPRADRPRPDALDLGGGAGPVDEGGLGLSPAAARGGGGDERDRHRDPLAGPRRARSRAAPEGDRRRASHGLLSQPLRAPPRLHGAVRRHAREPRAALREHRLGEHPRSDRGADGAPALPGLRRGAPAAGEPRGHGGRPQHLRVHAVQRPGRAGVDRGAGADRHRAGDRAPGGARDRRAPAVPGQRRDRLPVAGARRHDALGRRGAADPARDPDRLLAGGRPLHPGRALDRPPPARQREADRHAAAAARPGQHGDRGRARRGNDPRRRPRRRSRPWRRRARG